MSASRPRASLLLVTVLILIGACAAPESREPVTEEAPPVTQGLLIEGDILTMDAALPRGTGLLARAGRVSLVGLDGLAVAEDLPLQRLRVPPGGVAMPGIIESHAHFVAVGRSRRIIDLRGAPSAEAVVERVRQKAATVAPGTWIEGRGWNQEIWSDRSFPDRAVLDAACPDHPVLLGRVDGHAVWCNGLALQMAGIDDSTASPAGGEIVRDASGRATGVLIDNAENLVVRVMPPEDEPERLVEDLLAAQDASLALGITTFVDAGTSDATLLELNRLYRQRQMKLRFYAMASVNDQADLDRVLARPKADDLFDGRAAVRAIKLYADGALGSRGAWLLEPYTDRHDHSGLETLDPAFVEQAARKALAAGYQVCVHAIGDRANRETLNAFERAFLGRDDKETRGARFRIEHAQILDRGDIARFAKMGVLPSMQTCHAISDGPWVEDRLGAERVHEGAYPWRDLLETGSIIPNGTDAPVEDLSPWRNLFAAVWRGTEDGTKIFTPIQRMNRYEALQSLTVWGAYGIFAEEDRGSLRPGQRADIVILDRDPSTCTPFELLETKVLATIIEGELVYEHPDYAAWRNRASN